MERASTLPDRPGALATLARECGDAGVNILGLQIFPGVETVTDELVLQHARGLGPRPTSPSWSSRPAARRSAGRRAPRHALADQPTRYVQAARTILAQPARFPEVVARLFDAEADPVDGGSSRCRT